MRTAFHVSHAARCADSDSRPSCLKSNLTHELTLTNHGVNTGVTRWRYGYSVGLAIERSQVRTPARALLRNNLRQVVHTLCASVNKRYTGVKIVKVTTGRGVVYTVHNTEC